MLNSAAKCMWSRSFTVDNQTPRARRRRVTTRPQKGPSSLPTSGLSRGSTTCNSNNFDKPDGEILELRLFFKGNSHSTAASTSTIQQPQPYCIVKITSYCKTTYKCMEWEGKPKTRDEDRERVVRKDEKISSWRQTLYVTARCLIIAMGSFCSNQKE